MLRTVEARRALRRVMAVVCAASLAAALSVGLLAGRGHSARAEPLTRPAAAPRAAAAVASAAASAATSAAAMERPPLPATRKRLMSDAGKPVFAYPPLSAGGPRKPVPVVMMLHGMCGDAELACDFWSDAGREGSFLVCPAGNAECGDYDDWKGTGAEKAAALDAGMAAVDRAFEGDIDHTGDILIGFSRGAFVARDVAYERPGKFRALILIGASMTPDAARFRASGIRRVVMAAGEYDGARPTMQRAARILDKAGLPSRFMSLGRIGHWLPADLEGTLREALRWAREEERAEGGA